LKWRYPKRENMNKKDCHRDCPICQNTASGEILYTQKFILPEHHILPNEYNLVACSKCGFVYVDTLAGQDIYDKYYAKMSMYETPYINQDTSLYVDRAAWINTFIPDKNSSIIEVGCGNGRLLLELQNLGFSNLAAIDPSQECINFIRNRGIDGAAKSIFEGLSGRQYDYVILQGVLEHIYDIPRIMQAVKLFAKPSGLLFIGVPDASRYQDYDAVPYDYFNLEHINHFDETALINLGFRYGLRSVSLFKTVITLAQVKQPVIYCVYQNGSGQVTDWQNSAKSSIVNYIAKTQRNKSASAIIDKLVQSQEEVIVWGVGNYTNRLLANSNLNKCNIIGFVDKDKHKQGGILCGKPVVAPEAILGMPKRSTILVVAAVFYNEILADIENMGIGNKMVVLK
jgi:SAM-dependent methyltransferase